MSTEKQIKSAVDYERQVVMREANFARHSGRILAAAAENLERLATCFGPVHNFEAMEPFSKTSGRWKCSVCLGTVSNDQRHWYELGLKHGKGGAV